MSETTKAPTFTSRLRSITAKIEGLNAMATSSAEPGSMSAISMLMAAYFHPEWARAAAELLLAESADGGMESGRRTADRIVALLPIEMEMPQ